MLKRLAALGLLAGMTLSAPLQVIAQQAQPSTPTQPYWGPGPWHMWGDYGWPFWWMPFPMMFFFLLLCVGMVYFMFVRGHHGGPLGHGMDRMWGHPTYSALQILNERFARGEIQKDEYEDRKAAILSGPPR